MRIFLSNLADGSIRLRGISDGPDRALMWLLSPKGKPLCGLPYEEAIQYAWIDTTDAGEFVVGERRPAHEAAS